MRQFIHIILIIGLLLVSLIETKGQKLNIFTDPPHCHHVLDRDQGLLYVIAKDSVKIIDIATFKIIDNIRVSNIPDCANLDGFDPVCLDKHIYLVNHSGGDIYLLDRETLVRIDHSSFQKEQLNCTTFTHDGKIFRYGGYGFWSFRNFFTYFDFTTREWEIVQPTGSTIFPQGSNSGTIVKIVGDDWYVFGGFTFNPALPVQLVKNEECWIFHWEKKAWEHLGKLKINIIPAINTAIEYENQLIWLSGPVSYVMDLQKNQVRTFNNPSPIQAIRNATIDWEYNNPDYFKGMFYFIGASNMDTKNCCLWKVKESDYLTYFVNEASIYSNDRMKILIVILWGICLVTLIFLFWMYKREKQKEKIWVDNGKLIFKLKEVELEELQYGLLQLFMIRKEMTTNDIMEYIKKDQLHYSQNTRIINKLVDALNFKFNLIMDSNLQLIQMQKSTIDKRIKAYVLQNEYFHPMRLTKSENEMKRVATRKGK